MSDDIQIVGASPAKVQRVSIEGGSASDGAIVDGASSSIKATVKDYTNSNPLAVVTVDTNGDYVSGSGGTQYTEDAAAAANPVGTALNLVRDDARGGSLTTTDGDNVAARGTNAGELYVKHVDSVAVTNAGLTELAAAINASSQMDVNIAASGATVPVSNSGLTELAAAINASSQMDVNIAASGATVPVSNAGLTALNGAISGTEVQVDVVAALPAGTNAIGKLAANSGVDIGDVDVTSIVPGTGATNLGKAEDAAAASGDSGVAILGVRKDTPNTALTDTDGDYGHIALNKLGSVRTALQEDDFAVAGSNHVKKYYTSAGAVTDGIVWSPAAGKRWYVTDIFIGVSAAATVTLEDDLAGGDSAVFKMEFAANSGWSHKFATPLFSGEDAADLLVTTSAGNVYITITGYEI